MLNYYNPYNNPYYQQPMRQGDYININNEQEAINYPIAPNTNLIFIDWGNKKVYEKTKGLSPSDIPAMKQYNLVEVVESQVTPDKERTNNSAEYAEKSEIESLRSEIERINSVIKRMNVKEKVDE